MPHTCDAPMAERHDTEQLIDLLTSNQTRLRAYVFSLTADREMAMEVLQSTNLVIWRRAEEFQPGTNFIAWAFKIARLQVLAHRNRSARNRVVFSEELITEIAGVASEEPMLANRDDTQAALAECLETIPEERRALLWLRYRDNLSIGEVAAKAGRSVGATKQLMHRLRVALMRCVERRLANGDL